MSEVKIDAAGTEVRVPIFQKVIYGLGMFCNNLVPAAMGCMAVVLNLGLGMNPALIGYILSLPRIVDAFTDPVMGYISDHTKSRFGRRKPYIFFGAILLGITFALMWRIGHGHSEMFYFWFFMLGFNILFIWNTIFATPFTALGYEMTPDYNERTSVQAWANWLGQLPWLLTPWFWYIMANKTYFDNPVIGAQTIALWVGVAVVIFGVMPGIFCREPFLAVAETELTKEKSPGLIKHTTDFFKGFAITLKNKEFLKIIGATFFVFNGYMIIAGLAMYIFIYFTFGGDQAMGGKYNGFFGTTSALSTVFIVIPIVTRLAKKIGKKSAFIVSTSISIIGFVIKWWCFNPVYSSLFVPNLPLIGEVHVLILLPAILISFGMGSVFTIMGSMMGDTCDLDELVSGKRREGMYGAIYWWILKLGMSLAFAISGNILNLTGFNVSLGAQQSAGTLLNLRLFDIGLPILTTLLAIFCILTYPINEAKANETRLELEKRRGKVA